MFDLIMDKISEKIAPLKKNAFLQGQPPSLDDILPYEYFFKDEGRTIFCVSSFRYGLIWEIFPLAHEMMPRSSIEAKLESLQNLLNELRNEKLTFQFIYSSIPSDEDVSVPDTAKNFCDKIALKRKIHLKSLCDHKDHTLMKRKLYLTMCLDGSVRTDASTLNKLVSMQQTSLTEDIFTIRDIAETIERLLSKSFYFKNSHSDSLLSYLRTIFHSSELGEELNPVNLSESGNLKDKILRDFCEFNPDNIGVGEDTWEVLSWAGQPEGEISKAAMVKILTIKEPIVAVINLRGSNDHGIEEKVKKTKLEGDPLKEKQNEELRSVQKALVRNSELTSVSLHVLVKNINIHHKDKHRLNGKKISKILRKELKIEFFVERFAARAVFLSCLPLCFSGEASAFIRRSFRVLSSTVPSYLPVYGGMKGSPYDFQMMVNRASELISLDPADSPTNPHLAILGGSGTGKSFYLVSLIMAAFAKDPNFAIFCIDNIASYKFTGKTLGEDVGFSFSEPPENFPNLFKGQFDPDRIPVISGILCAAVSIVCGETVSPTEQFLLSNSIKITYIRNREISEKKYIESENGLGHWEKSDEKIKLPRLTDIINNFSTILREEGLDNSIATKLRNKLVPFIGDGPYAQIFDRQEYQNREDKIAGFNLYDLQHISDEKLKTITSLLIVADVYRMMGILNKSSGIDGEVKNIKAFLIFEEVGVNLQSDNKELAKLVINLVPTLRKRGILCIGVGNSLEQYSKKYPAAQTIWKIAHNKLILGLDENKEDILASGLLKDLEADVIASLDKITGSYSEGLWINRRSTFGTFRYYPTGFEYWLAANEDGDVTALEKTKSIHGSYQKAVLCLGELYPSGFRNQFGKHRKITATELENIRHWEEN